MGQVRHSRAFFARRDCDWPPPLRTPNHCGRRCGESAGGDGAGAQAALRSGAGRPGRALMSLQTQLAPPTARAAEVRPLVLRCGAFGDIVLLTVLLRQLHLRFGKPVDVISSGPWTPPLLEGESAVGRLFMIRSRRT